MPLNGALAVADRAFVPCEATREAIVSWNAPAPIALSIRIYFQNGEISPWLSYTAVDPWRSLSPVTNNARVAVDILHAEVALGAVEVQGAGLAAAYVSWPPPARYSASLSALRRVMVPCGLTVPQKTQYVGRERGWCNAAAVAMVLEYWMQCGDLAPQAFEVADIAAALYDDNYGGTGNWTFATAYAARCGLQAAVAYLPDLNTVYELVQAHIPVILATAWNEGELPGAPLTESAGHLLVVRGFAREGAVLVNDPALPEIGGSYPSASFEKLWQRAGGIAYIIAPLRLAPRAFALLQRQV